MSTDQAILFDGRHFSLEGRRKPRCSRPAYDGSEARLRRALRLFWLWGLTVCVVAVDGWNDVLVLCHGLIGIVLFCYAKLTQVCVNQQIAETYIARVHERRWLDEWPHRASTSRTRWGTQRASAVSGTKHMAYGTSISGTRADAPFRHRFRGRKLRGLEFLQ